MLATKYKAKHTPHDRKYLQLLNNTPNTQILGFHQTTANKSHPLNGFLGGLLSEKLPTKLHGTTTPRLVPLDQVSEPSIFRLSTHAPSVPARPMLVPGVLSELGAEGLGWFVLVVFGFGLVGIVGLKNWS